jgi:hypothetical protein
MWIRAALLMVSIWLGFLFLLNLGFSRRASALSMALFLFATPTVAGTIRLTGEIVALPALFAAGVLATRYQGSVRWKRQALVVSVLLAVILLSKELTLPLCAGIVVLAALWPGSTGRKPNPTSRRNRFLGLAAAATLLPLVARIGWVAMGVDPDGYVNSYGSAELGGVHLARVAIRMFLPVHPERGNEDLFFLAFCLFVLILGIGFLAGIRRRTHTRVSFGWWLLPFLITLAGSASYLPWPRMEGFYPLPYLVGPTLLFAVALRVSEGFSAVQARLFRILCWTLVLVAGAVAFNLSDQTYARRRLNRRLVNELSSIPADTVVHLGPILRSQHRWQGTGPTLLRYGEAMGIPRRGLPAMRDGLCDELAGRGVEGPEPPLAFLVIDHVCPEGGSLFLSIEESFRRVRIAAPLGRVERLEAQIRFRGTSQR